MTGESNYAVVIATLSDWFKNLVSVFQPMRSKTNSSPASSRCVLLLWLVWVITAWYWTFDGNLKTAQYSLSLDLIVRVSEGTISTALASYALTAREEAGTGHF